LRLLRLFVDWESGYFRATNLSSRLPRRAVGA
jgi:hypothetical protein